MNEEVEQLIRGAGSRLAPGADRAARVRATVEREWRAQARARRVRRWTAGVAVTLMAAATVFFAVRHRWAVAPPAPAQIGSVAAARGSVKMEIPDDRVAVAVVGQTVTAGATIRTDGSSRATVTLIDAGEVRIDANTVATLVDARTIQLERGAIYLDSGASTPGSFTVRTASGTIRDIGTRFEVRSLLRQGSRGQTVPLSIKVRHGAVQLEREGRIDRAPIGTELLVSAEGTVSTKTIDSFAADWAWTTDAAPTFIVENATLEAFLQWAEREGGWTMAWSDTFRQHARTTILHGSIDGMTPADALNAVLPTCGLSSRVVNGRLIINDLGSRFGGKGK